MSKTQAVETSIEVEEEGGPRGPAPRVVYAEAPVLLGRVLRAEGDGYVVQAGGREIPCAVEEEVDPRLLGEGAQVLVDNATRPPRIAGAVMTSLPLTIDATGAVEATIRRLDLLVEEEAMLRTRVSFLRVRGKDIELYARDVIARARDNARILAAMIRLN